MAHFFLLLGEPEIERIRVLVEHASKIENYDYSVRNGGPPPGDDPKHVVRLGSFRCVFSFTVGRDGVFRKLSISNTAGRNPPHPVPCEEIAKLIGFDFEDRDHPIERGLHEGRIAVLVQKIKAEA